MGVNPFEINPKQSAARPVCLNGACDAPIALFQIRPFWTRTLLSLSNGERQRVQLGACPGSAPSAYSSWMNRMSAFDIRMARIFSPFARTTAQHRASSVVGYCTPGRTSRGMSPTCSRSKNLQVMAAGPRAENLASCRSEFCPGEVDSLPAKASRRALFKKRAKPCSAHSAKEAD